MKQRGIFEKRPGSGIWWICYFDQFGKKRREKAGTKSVAIKLYGKRKQQVLEGKKLPENFRKPFVKLSQLLDDALAYSKRNKRSYQTDVPRFASLKEWFGSHPAEELTPKEIENTLARAADKENGNAAIPTQFCIHGLSSGERRMRLSHPHRNQVSNCPGRGR